MNELAQSLTVTIAAAAAYVARRSWLSLRGRSSGCGGGCNGCGADRPGGAALVQLGDFRDAKGP